MNDKNTRKKDKAECDESSSSGENADDQSDTLEEEAPPSTSKSDGSEERILVRFRPLLPYELQDHKTGKYHIIPPIRENEVVEKPTRKGTTGQPYNIRQISKMVKSTNRLNIELLLAYHRWFAYNEREEARRVERRINVDAIPVPNVPRWKRQMEAAGASSPPNTRTSARPHTSAECKPTTEKAPLKPKTLSHAKSMGTLTFKKAFQKNKDTFKSTANLANNRAREPLLSSLRRTESSARVSSFRTPEDGPGFENYKAADQKKKERAATLPRRKKTIGQSKCHEPVQSPRPISRKEAVKKEKDPVKHVCKGKSDSPTPPHESSSSSDNEYTRHSPPQKPKKDKKPVGPAVASPAKQEKKKRLKSDHPRVEPRQEAPRKDRELKKEKLKPESVNMCGGQPDSPPSSSSSDNEDDSSPPPPPQATHHNTEKDEMKHTPPMASPEKQDEQMDCDAATFEFPLSIDEETGMDFDDNNINVDSTFHEDLRKEVDEAEAEDIEQVVEEKQKNILDAEHEDILKDWKKKVAEKSYASVLKEFKDHHQTLKNILLNEGISSEIYTEECIPKISVSVSMSDDAERMLRYLRDDKNPSEQQQKLSRKFNLGLYREFDYCFQSSAAHAIFLDESDVLFDDIKVTSVKTGKEEIVKRKRVVPSTKDKLPDVKEMFTVTISKCGEMMTESLTQPRLPVIPEKLPVKNLSLLRPFLESQMKADLGSSEWIRIGDTILTHAHGYSIVDKTAEYSESVVDALVFRLNQLIPLQKKDILVVNTIIGCSIMKMYRPNLNGAREIERFKLQISTHNWPQLLTIVFPVVYSCHWYLVVVQLRERGFQLFDPFQVRHKINSNLAEGIRNLRKVMEFCRPELFDPVPRTNDMKNVDLLYIRTLEKQFDTVSCGPIVIEAVRHILGLTTPEIMACTNEGLWNSVRTMHYLMLASDNATTSEIGAQINFNDENEPGEENATIGHEDETEEQ